MTLAYIPFIDPIHALHEWWYLLILPLAAGISVIYRAVRAPTLDHFWRGVGMMTTQIILAMAALALLLLGLVQFVIPRLPAE